MTLVACLVAWVAIWIVAGAGAMFSEDWVHLGIAARQESLLEAFDLGRVPLRPLQHVAFYVLAELGVTEGLVARGLGLVGHLLAIIGVFALGREWGRTVAAGVASAVLFALAPNVVSVLSPAALGWPWRIAFSLWALVLFEVGWRLRSKRAALGCWGLWVLALGCHQGALVLPGVAALRVLFLAPPGQRLKGLFRPGLAGWCALAAGYVVYMQFFRDATGHGLKELASLPANVVRAELALFPEPLRLFAVNGLRSETPIGTFLGGSIVALAFGFASYLWFKGGALARFVLAAIALDLVLPVLTTGFASRYAYLSFALGALGVGVAASRSLYFDRARTLFVVVALAWGADLVHEVFEFRQASRWADHVIETVREAEADGGTVAIIDVPERIGRELELQFFGLGLAQALDLAIEPKDRSIFRTWENFHTTDVPFVPFEEVRDRGARGEFSVLVWSRVEQRLTPLR